MSLISRDVTEAQSYLTKYIQIRCFFVLVLRTIYIRHKESWKRNYQLPGTLTVNFSWSWWLHLHDAWLAGTCSMSSPQAHLWQLEDQRLINSSAPEALLLVLVLDFWIQILWFLVPEYCLRSLFGHCPGHWAKWPVSQSHYTNFCYKKFWREKSFSV